jgi:hypothetical protein
MDAITILSIWNTYEMYKEVRGLMVMQNIEYVIWLQFWILQIYNYLLHHAYTKDTLLHTFVILIAISKRI